MLRNRRILFLAAFSLAQACAGSHDATAPVVGEPSKPEAKDARVMIADGPIDLIAEPGQTLEDFARVKLTMQKSGKPIEGAKVTFVSGDQITKVVTTGADGVAHFGPWKTGSQAGSYTVVASGDSVAPVLFTAYVRPEIAVVARYDLQSIAGKGLPIQYSGGGKTWEVVGGHYVLFADGTFDFYYDFSPSKPRSLLPIGKYVRSANGVIDFYLTGSFGPFYSDRNGHFARGDVSGDVMRMTYEDFVDFEEEVYVAK